MVYILAISGPTAAGKTYFSNKLVEVVEKHGYTISKISTDEFYHDLSHMTMEMRSQVNYDLPQSIDAEGFETCLEQLSLGKVTDVPVYDFSTHTRTGEIRTVTPPDLLIVEGIFSLSFEGSNRLYDLKVFIELDRDLRLIRRMERDMKERGRSLESIVHQYLSQVRPSQNTHVLLDRMKADMILSGDRDHSSIFELIVAKLHDNA